MFRVRNGHLGVQIHNGHGTPDENFRQLPNKFININNIHTHKQLQQQAYRNVTHKASARLSTRLNSIQEITIIYENQSRHHNNQNDIRVSQVMPSLLVSVNGSSEIQVRFQNNPIVEMQSESPM